MRITESQLRRTIRSVLKEQADGTIEIAGTPVKVVSKASISDMVRTAQRRDSSRPYSSTHELWTAKPGELPEETVERFMAIVKRGLPGTVKVYQDPDTAELFAYAKYNTF